MSYDLMVFDPSVAPRSRPEFMESYENVTTWAGERDHTSPQGMSGNLVQFYERLRGEFPPMNGPDSLMLLSSGNGKGVFGRILSAVGISKAAPHVDDQMIADYSFTEHAIYIGFTWRVEKLAYNRVVNVALDTEVGFFDASSDNGHILYDTDDFYALMGL